MADGIPAATGGRIRDEGERNDVLQTAIACYLKLVTACFTTT
ncbi:hypothetical protein [Herbaspirillum camelliae]|nr:hypothetical protein [Herbaspirillum camelliae]